MRGYRMALAQLALLAVGGCGGASAQPGPAEPWAWEMPYCPGYRAEDYQAPAHRLAVEVREQPGVVELVETYHSGWGPRAVAEIRVVLRECGSYEYGERGDPRAFLEQHLVLRTGFAGDESLLVETVRLRPPDTETRYAVVVRRDDVVSTVRGSRRTDVLCAADATCPAGQT
jgi:hypothetical protein